MSTSTTTAGPRIAIMAIVAILVIGTLIWTAMQIGNLRREQTEQARRLQAAVAAPVAAAAPRPEPVATPDAPPPNWAEQLAEIRNETRQEIAKLQEQMRRSNPAETQLASLREENKAELARLRSEMTASEQSAATPARERQDDLLRSLRDQVRALDRRTAGLASAIRGTRAARSSRAAARVARRKRLALSPVTTARNGNVTVVYPSQRR